ncbi:MAG TPA: histidine kinase dimerization/phospho-acceptor domain-containing protein [Gemmatimonadaceae bacterium]|nr:histidine kinase dimerization/phospho-acceptor domain-containing protein [Gemmatimonadaceae bacterium]
MSESAGELWLTAFQRLATRAAHEIRNPLNGVVVNVEVLRGRLSRAGSDPGRLATFAELASGEIARSAELIEALLALARPPSGNLVDLREVLGPLVVLYRAVAARNGGSLETVDPPKGPDAPSGRSAVLVDALSARLAIASILDHSVEGPARVTCWAAAVGGAPTVGVTRDGGGLTLQGLERLLRAIPSVRIDQGPDTVRIVFPAPGAANHGA